MNNRGLITSVTAILIYFSAQVMAVPYVSPTRFLEIPLAIDVMSMDGIDSEGCWSEAQDVRVFISDGWSGPADMDAYFKLTWDPDFLYLYANITDDINHSLTPPDNPSAWMFDCLEVYLDLDTVNHPSTDYDQSTIQLRFNRGAEKIFTPGRTDAGNFILFMEDKAGNDGWIIEVAIPWTSVMPAGSLPEDINDYIANAMGFDVIISDSDNSDGDANVGNRDVQTAWDEDGLNGTEDLAWNNTSVFGIIELLTEPPLPAIPYNDPVRTLDIPARIDRIEFDGAANEASWSAQQSTSIFNAGGWTGSSDFDVSLKLSWDMEYLYFFADITDDVEHNWTTGLGNPWMFDGVEFFIDLDTVMGYTEYDDNTIQLRFVRGDMEIETSGRAPATDYKYFWKNKSGGDGWVIEAGIPWTCAMPVGYDPEDIEYFIANKMGLDINFADSDNSDGDASVGNRDTQAAWDNDLPDGDLSEDLAWNNTHVFGIVALIGEPAPPEPDPVGLAFIEPVWEIDVPGKQGEFQADAKDNEFFWSYPQNLTIYNPIDYDGEADLSVNYRTAWDMTYLYLYASITDDIKQSWYSGAADDPVNYDNLELYLDLDTFALETDYRSTTTFIRFSRGLDVVETAGRASTTDFIYAWENRTDGTGWEFEAAIPWTTALPAGANSGDIADYLPVIAFDIMVTDRDSEASAEHLDLTLAAWDPDNEEGENLSAPLEDLVLSNTRAFGIANLSPYVVGLNDPGETHTLKVFPNPAKDILFVENLEAVQRLDIINLNGQVLNSRLNLNGSVVFDLREYRRGIYLVKIFRQDGTSESAIFTVE